MGKKTVSVAYEDPRFSRKEAAYWSQVRNALDAMGAPNSGELLHNSKAYVEGVYRAGLPAIDAAAVILHQHCGKAGQQLTPCVAEDNLVSGEPWKLLEPGLWEWQTMPYPPGGYAIPQKPRRGGFELGRWDSRIGRPSFAALAIYPSLDAAQNAAAMYAALPGGRETAAQAGHPLLPRVVVYIDKKSPTDFHVTAKMQKTYNGPWTEVQRMESGSAAAARHAAQTMQSGWASRVKSVEIAHGSPGAEECPCEADGAEETSKLRTVKYLKVGD